MLDFLKNEGIDPTLIQELQEFRRTYPADGADSARIRTPRYFYYGKNIWEEAIAALLCGEHLLLTGPKATGKNVFAENLAAAFGRPIWNISLSINTDAASLIGADTFRDGQVVFREGPVSKSARLGGFGVLDEINMAKNEALAVLHEALDFRGSIDVPGYDRIELHGASRFIATMNYGYAGTRELNEALASRFVVIDMPPISEEYLTKLFQSEFPSLSPKWSGQFCRLFQELQAKCSSFEISPKALDLRGLLSAVRLMEKGLNAQEALRLGIGNKIFDPYERKLIGDLFDARIPKRLERGEIFGGA
ncbi:MAG: MoxR family ATPase [Eubacteriales bacterium]|nr:MoxR family ATPase [Eubacteriales bacterium]